jgi:hypothetical protein
LSFGHDHDDANGFYLFRNGHWLAPETVGEEGSETGLHNTLLIDGQGQFRPPNDDQKSSQAMASMDGYLETVANTPTFNYVAADATRRYKQFQDLLDFTRHVLFVRPGYFLMVDNVAATEAHQYEWIAHFGESVAIEGDWIRGNAAGGQVLGIGIMAPEAFATQVSSDGHPLVRLRPAVPVASLRFVNLLYPTDSTSWAQRPAITLVADDGGMLLARITGRDNSQQQDDILLTYDTPGAMTTLANYTFDGHVAVIQRMDGKIKKVFVYGGTVLRDEETEINWLTGRAGSGALEIAYESNTVFINGRLSSSLTLYAPEGEKLLVNGQPWSYSRAGDYITLEAQR